MARTLETDKQPTFKLFLSHSSIDKPAVERLARELKKHGVDTWVDKAAISPGDNFAEKIEQGLVECTHFVIWITENSINSPWVKAEYFAALDRKMSGNVVILPLIGAPVDLPPFLKSIESIDFTTEWDAAFEKLAALFDIELTGRPNQSPISQFTKEYIEGLSTEQLTFPLADPINIIDTLKILPRSGKIVRLENYTPRVPIRSIYDHIISMAHTADSLWKEIDHGVPDYQQTNLALCIAFHELNEVLIGDIPYLTDLTTRKQKSAHLHAYDRLERFKGIEELEAFTNNFLKMFLDTRNLTYMDQYQNIRRAKKGSLYQLFQLIDKIDPIVAIWRYLHVFRDKLDEDASIFLAKVADFFGNGRAQEICHSFPDPKVGKMAEILFDRELAREFYRDSNVLREASRKRGLAPGMMTRLVQSRAFTYSRA